MRKAQTFVELRPLIQLIQQGKLFDVQNWIDQGMPINPPDPEPKKPRRGGPIEHALAEGFHSMAQVLLEAGANLTEPGTTEYNRFSATEKAVQMNRLDLVQLLVQHGADLSDVSMYYAFQTWNPAVMNFCIDQGCDPEVENDLARALCERIRTALGVYKRYHDRFASFQDQLNLALRFHTEQMNQKWVALTLWAGADPYGQGRCDVYWDTHHDGESAIEIALYKEWDWFFEQKSIQLDASHLEAKSIFESVCRDLCCPRFESFIGAGFAKGFSVKESTKVIEHMIYGMMSGCSRFSHYDPETKIWEYETRDYIGGGLSKLGALFEQGWKWVPPLDSLRSMRLCLLQFEGHGLIEFFELIRTYKTASREILHELLRTDTMQGKLKAQRFDPDKYLEFITW